MADLPDLGVYTTAERGFMEAIAADPGDETARLAHLDWLDENGRTAKADYIRAVRELHAHPGMNCGTMYCAERSPDGLCDDCRTFKRLSRDVRAATENNATAGVTPCDRCDQREHGNHKWCAACADTGDYAQIWSPARLVTERSERYTRPGEHFRPGLGYERGYVARAWASLDLLFVRSSAAHPEVTWAPTPLLAALLRWHPIENVFVYTFSAVAVGGQYQYFRGGRVEPESPYRLPEPIFDALDTPLTDTLDTGVTAREAPPDHVLGAAIATYARNWIKTHLPVE